MLSILIALGAHSAWAVEAAAPDHSVAPPSPSAHSSPDATFTTLLQACASGAPQSAAIRIADGHPTPQQALLLYHTLLGRGSTAAALIALQGLAQLGPAARAAAPEVAALLTSRQDPAVRSAGLHALLALQPTAPNVPEASACLQDARLPPHARADAAQLLGGWGPVARSSRPLLAALVADPDGDLAGAAYDALVAMEPTTTTSGSEVAPVAGTASLVPGEVLERQVSAFAALPDGLYDASLCSRLLSLAGEDPRRGARMMAWTALARGGVLQATVVAAFLQQIVLPDPDLQQLCAAALLGDAHRGFSGPGAGPAVVQVLAQALGAGPEPMRCALGALTRLGPAGAAAGPELWPLLEQRDGSLVQIAGCLAVVRAWGHLDPAAQERLARLLDPTQEIYAERTHDQADAIQAMLLSTLVSVGVPPGARRWILASLASPDPVTPAAFAAAARAVISEGPSGRYAVTSLLPALEVGFTDAALDVDNLPALMRRSHPVAGEMRTIPAGSPSARWYAIRALGAIGPAAAVALPGLRAISAHGLAQGNSAILQDAAAAAVHAIQEPGG